MHFNSLLLQLPILSHKSETKKMSGGGGGGTEGGMSKLGTVLTIIFVVSLAALLAEVFYVLWRRRSFRLQSSRVSGGDQLSQPSSTSESNFSPIASSKELLYLFCIRPQSRLERSAITLSSNANREVAVGEEEMEVIDVDLMKFSGMFGPPRFLFTIKEEEKEDMDSPAEIEKRRSMGGNGIARVSLEECLEVAIEIRHDDDATPFSTPCDSPVYFTPTDSPAGEVVDDPSTRGDGGGTVVTSSQV